MDFSGCRDLDTTVKVDNFVFGSTSNSLEFSTDTSMKVTNSVVRKIHEFAYCDYLLRSTFWKYRNIKTLMQR